MVCSFPLTHFKRSSVKGEENKLLLCRDSWAAYNQTGCANKDAQGRTQFNTLV